MPDWTDIAALAVATLQLAEVQDVISAIDNADLASAASAGTSLSFGPAAVYEPRLHVLLDPVYERRQVIHPEPCYEARPVIHPEPRVAAIPEVHVDTTHSNITPSPIQPPWKVLPWQNPLPMTPKIKVVVRPPDICCKGTMLDCFL